MKSCKTVGLVLILSASFLAEASYGEWEWELEFKANTFVTPEKGCVGTEFNFVVKGRTSCSWIKEGGMGGPPTKPEIKIKITHPAGGEVTLTPTSDDFVPGPLHEQWLCPYTHCSQEATWTFEAAWDSTGKPADKYSWQVTVKDTKPWGERVISESGTLTVVKVEIVTESSIVPGQFEAEVTPAIIVTPDSTFTWSLSGLAGSFNPPGANGTNDGNIIAVEMGVDEPEGGSGVLKVTFASPDVSCESEEKDVTNASVTKSYETEMSAQKTLGPIDIYVYASDSSESAGDQFGWFDYEKAKTEATLLSDPTFGWYEIYEYVEGDALPAGFTAWAETATDEWLFYGGDFEIAKDGNNFASTAVDILGYTENKISVKEAQSTGEFFSDELTADARLEVEIKEDTATHPDRMKASLNNGVYSAEAEFYGKTGSTPPWLKIFLDNHGFVKTGSEYRITLFPDVTAHVDIKQKTLTIKAAESGTNPNKAAITVNAEGSVNGELYIKDSSGKLELDADVNGQGQVTGKASFTDTNVTAEIVAGNNGTRKGKIEVVHSPGNKINVQIDSTDVQATGVITNGAGNSASVTVDAAGVTSGTLNVKVTKAGEDNIFTYDVGSRTGTVELNKSGKSVTLSVASNGKVTPTVYPPGVKTKVHAITVDATVTPPTVKGSATLSHGGNRAKIIVDATNQKVFLRLSNKVSPKVKYDITVSDTGEIDGYLKVDAGIGTAKIDYGGGSANKATVTVVGNLSTGNSVKFTVDSTGNYSGEFHLTDGVISVDLEIDESRNISGTANLTIGSTTGDHGKATLTYESVVGGVSTAELKVEVIRDTGNRATVVLKNDGEIAATLKLEKTGGPLRTLTFTRTPAGDISVSADSAKLVIVEGAIEGEMSLVSDGDKCRLSDLKLYDPDAPSDRGLSMSFDENGDIAEGKGLFKINDSVKLKGEFLTKSNWGVLGVIDNGDGEITVGYGSVAQELEGWRMGITDTVGPGTYELSAFIAPELTEITFVPTWGDVRGLLRMTNNVIDKGEVKYNDGTNMLSAAYDDEEFSCEARAVSGNSSLGFEYKQEDLFRLTANSTFVCANGWEVTAAGSYHTDFMGYTDVNSSLKAELSSDKAYVFADVSYRDMTDTDSTAVHSLGGTVGVVLLFGDFSMVGYVHKERYDKIGEVPIQAFVAGKLIFP